MIAINSAPTVPMIPTLPKPASRPLKWEPTIASVKRVERQAKTTPTHLRIESSLFVFIIVLSRRQTARGIFSTGRSRSQREEARIIALHRRCVCRSKLSVVIGCRRLVGHLRDSG